MYHIVFMYADNITVVSKMDCQVIYNVTYDKTMLLRPTVFERHFRFILV